MVLNLTLICALLQVSLPASASARVPLQIRGVNTLELAGVTDLCFAETVRQTDAVQASRAEAIIVPKRFPALHGPVLIRSPEPRKGFFRVAESFVRAYEIQGIHPSAVIDPTAILGKDVAVGPCAVIAADTQVGDSCTVGPGCYLGPGVTLGTPC